MSNRASLFAVFLVFGGSLSPWKTRQAGVSNGSRWCEIGQGVGRRWRPAFRWSEVRRSGTADTHRAWGTHPVVCAATSLGLMGLFVLLIGAAVKWLAAKTQRC